jgi:CRP/FNR family transcriptional regulator
MTITVETLRELPFFSQLSQDTLRNLVLVLHQRTFSPGQVILLEGESCQSVYFVAKGLVRARRMSLEGREHVLAYLGPGEALNLVPAFDRGSSLATMDAATEALLLLVPCRKFQQIVRLDHGLASAALEQLAREVRRLSDMVEDLALHTVRTRLARFLLAQVGGMQSRKQWTQEDIASHIGTVREMVGRSLRAFTAAGLVQRQRGRVVVLDREGLEKVALGE